MWKNALENQKNIHRIETNCDILTYFTQTTISAKTKSIKSTI